MIEFYKTFGTMTKKIDKPEKGCWISAIAPTQEECDYLIQEIGVLMLMQMKIQMNIHCFIQPSHLVLSL